MNITPGLFDNAAIFINNFDIIDVSKDRFERKSSLFYIHDLDYITDFLKYINFSFNTHLKRKNDNETYRLLLKLYIEKEDFSWRSKIVKGLKTHVFDTLTNDLKLIIDKYCLLFSETLDSFEWWVHNAYIGEKNKGKIIQGFKGEKLSIYYEEKILKIPKDLIEHTSLQNYIHGYDIKSIVSKDNKINKKIEVKTYNQKNKEVKIYLTRKEWETCLISKNYIFHIWVLSNQMAKLFILKENDIKPIVPIDSKNSEWKTPLLTITDIINKTEMSFTIDLNDEVYNF